MRKKKERTVKIIPIGEDISLKQFELSDAAEIYRIIFEGKEHLGGSTNFVNYILEMGDTEPMLISMVKVGKMIPEHTFVIQHNDVTIGLVGFKNYDDINSKADLAYFICEDMQGKGIMLRSVFALMSYACEELDINKLSIRCPIGNLRSSNIPRRLGFQIEGVERAGEKTFNNNYVDLEVYGMTKDDFLKLKEEVSLY